MRTLLMVSAAESEDRLDQHRPFVEAAADAGLQHVVYTASVGAAPDATSTLARDHHATEQMTVVSAMRYPFLSDNLYLDVAMVGTDGVIRGPAGTGRAAMVARTDVGRVAAAVLQDPDAHLDDVGAITGRRLSLGGLLAGDR